MRIDWTDVDEPTPWAKAAIGLMKRIAAVGWEKAMADEMEAPAIDDVDWLRTVVAFTAGQDPPKPESEYEFGMLRCPTCQDRLYVPGGDVFRSGRTYKTVQPCPERPCQAWAAAKQECAEEKDKRDRSKGRVKRPDGDISV